MKGQSQSDAEILIRKLSHLLSQTAGGYGDVPPAEIHPLSGSQYTDKADKIVQVVHRLARSHHDNMAHPLPRDPGNGIDLEQHLRRRKVALPSVQRRGTEGASHPAADLGGYADAVPVVIAHKHAFYEIVVGKREEILLRPVHGGNLPVYEP